MGKKCHILILPLFILSFACRPKYDPTPVYSTSNDFEKVLGWTENPTNNSHTVTDEKAHSGKFSCKINKDINYGYIFKQKLKTVTDKKISWVRVSAYCMYTGNLGKSNLACFLTDDKENLKVWVEGNLTADLDGKKNEWVYFKKDLNIASYNDPELNFNAFFWNAGKDEEIFIDDMKIEFFE